MKKILIIEDDNNFVEILKAAMADEDFEIFTAGDGKAGLKLVDTEVPDVIILDLNMLHMSGIEFLKQFHQSKHNMIPILVASNKKDAESISESMRFGVRGYITKSEQTVSAIISTIKDCLNV